MCVFTKQSKIRYHSIGCIACRHISYVREEREREKYVRIIVRLLLFILKFVCDAESIKFKPVAKNRYENNTLKNIYQVLNRSIS